MSDLTEPREWAKTFPMTLYVCPWCGDILRAPDGLAPYFCEGTDGVDRHPRAEFERYVVVPDDLRLTLMAIRNIGDGSGQRNPWQRMAAAALDRMRAEVE